MKGKKIADTRKVVRLLMNIFSLRDSTSIDVLISLDELKTTLLGFQKSKSTRLD